MSILLVNTTIEMQSALGTNITITAISNASEAVFTNSGTNGLSAGDLVVIDGVAGMTEMNGRVIRIKAGVSTTSFTAEGLDSTNFSTYTSGGTANEVTTMLTFDNASGFNFPEPNPNRIDVTPISSSVKVERFGLDDAANITIPMFSDPTAAHIVEMRAATKAKATRAFRVTLETGEIVIFNAYVAGGRGLDGSVGGAATSQCNLTLVADEQWFAS